MSGPARGPRAWILLPILLACALAYLPGLGGEYVYDDLLLVVRNPAITQPARLPELVSGAMWDFLEPDTAARIGYWRPLSSVALALGWHLGGGQPLAFHLVSLAAHLAATAVVFRLARRLTRNAPVAAGAALLFGLHPVHVESVTWISAINDPLFGLLSLLALDAFLAWRERGSRGSPWLAGAWFLAALLAKEMAVAVIPLALVLDLCRREEREDLRGVWSACRPLLLAAALFWLLRACVFASPWAGFDRTVTDFGVGPGRLMQLHLEVLGGGLWLLLWPMDLALFRPFVPELPAADPGYLRALACIAGLVVLIALLWRARARTALAAALLVPAALLPPLVRVQALGMFPVSDRFLYLSVLGSSLLLALAARRWLPRPAALTALCLLAAGYGMRTWTRAGDWRDERTLFAVSVEQSPRSPYVRWGYSRVLLQAYRERGDPADLRGALDQASEALDLLEAAKKGDATIFATAEDFHQANLCQAWALLYEAEIDRVHDFESVHKVFRMIAANYPRSAHARAGQGVAAMALGRLDEAQEDLEAAIALNPLYVEAYRNLGVLLLRRGEAAEAARAFEQTLALRPDGLDDLLWLGRALAQAGEGARALEIALRAGGRYPGASGPLALRGLLAAQAGAMDEALRLFDAALALDPDDGEAHLQRSKVLLHRGEKAGALTALLRACDLLPMSFEAHYNASALLLESSGLAGALAHLLRAYELRPAEGAGEVLRTTLEGAGIEHPDILLRLAEIDARRGERESALRWLDRAEAAVAKGMQTSPGSAPALQQTQRRIDDLRARLL